MSSFISDAYCPVKMSSIFPLFFSLNFQLSIEEDLAPKVSVTSFWTTYEIIGLAWLNNLLSSRNIFSRTNDKVLFIGRLYFMY